MRVFSSVVAFPENATVDKLYRMEVGKSKEEVGMMDEGGWLPWFIYQLFSDSRYSKFPYDSTAELNSLVPMLMLWYYFKVNKTHYSI